MSAGDYLLDTSFMVDYDRELATKRIGPARRTMAGLPARARYYVSPVTVAELILKSAIEPA